MANAWILPPLPFLSVAGYGTTAGDPAAVAYDYAGVVWRSGGGATLLIDLGSDRALDTVALFGVDGDPASTVAVQLATAAQGNGFAAGAFYDSPAQPLFAGAARLASGFGVSLWSTPAAVPPVRYVRLVFSAAVRVSRVVACQRIQLARNFGFGAGFGVKDLGSTDWSRRGVLLRQRGAKLRTCALTFSSVYRDEVERQVQPLLELVGVTEPVGLVTDPAADAMRERRCFFGPLSGGDIGTTWRNAQAYEWKAAMVSLF
ncbi:hypothetical protein [Sphingomonas morindae]|uniref:F5/8 type C domain-containing protein n=1 Tax=Sphingomonas morindae TaxID=1541170 RepID=A0ABY4X424_9SPHN|nr:hypothetical protein [Sphingomonas morindae]USI71611.1 hypothetical protein LHA26_09705 [Sphingomonas morindae]